MTAVEVLKVAAARVRQGWGQWSLDDGYGNVCAHGAIRVGLGLRANTAHDEIKSYPNVEELREIYIAVVRALCSEADVWCEVTDRGVDSGIADWNNRAGQTAKNVAATLERAARKLEQAA